MTTMTDARAVEVLAAMREDGGVVSDADYTAAIDRAVARLREPAEAQAQGGGEAVFDLAYARMLADYVVGYARSAELKPLSSDACFALRDLHAMLHAAPPSAPVGVEGLPQPFGYVEPRHDLSGYEVFDEPGPRRVAIWNMHGMRKALAQPRAHYSIDADPDGIRERVADAITGALSFGAQGAHKPPAGHWLEPFWDMARAEREDPSPPTVGEATARRLDDYLGGEFDIRIGKQAAHAALVHALAQQPAAVDEAMVERAAEAAWPEFKSGLEERSWSRAPEVRKDRLRIIVRAALAAQPGGPDNDR